MDQARTGPARICTLAIVSATLIATDQDRLCRPDRPADKFHSLRRGGVGRNLNIVRAIERIGPVKILDENMSALKDRPITDPVVLDRACAVLDAVDPVVNAGNHSGAYENPGSRRA